MRRLAAVLLLPLLATACFFPTESFERFETFQVAPFTVTCYGPWERQCLQTRSRSSEPWLNFYGEIEGFEYASGYTYVLEVAVYRIHNPPQDGPGARYLLRRVISKKATPPA